MTTTDSSARRGLLPLDLGPAYALRSYGRLALVAVVIPALVVGLLAAIYATATRAPAVVLVSVSVCAVVFLLDVGSRGLRSSGGAASNRRTQKRSWTGKVEHDALGRFNELLREAARSTGREGVDPHAPGHTPWEVTEGLTHDAVREQVRTVVRRLHSEGYLHPRPSSSSAVPVRALAALAIQSGHAPEESQELFQRAINIDSSSSAYSLLAWAVLALEEDDTENALALFRRAIEVSDARASSSRPQ